jgi:hypothetical protein
LYDANVAPSDISKIMSTMRDTDNGTFLPKTLFNISEKGRTLLDIADGIIVESMTDAEKTIHYLNK